MHLDKINSAPKANRHPNILLKRGDRSGVRLLQCFYGLGQGSPIHILEGSHKKFRTFSHAIILNL